ncbi:hypothetical protein [Gimesia fumaroli]|uniref:Thioredoxin domain-containing protein n=1 Tax=Gimesia fumaroli TaxID=2527976 RepID=A0A518IA78_9PLAN|nr:hypothetical protein [Gimesia fumaroli]QDV49922.1 hypothetical protein Enr17x_19440 [Gimesia fumaroli]
MVSKTGYSWTLIIGVMFFQASLLKSEENQTKGPSELEPNVVSKSVEGKKGLKRFRVGQKAPLIEGFASDGNVSNIETNKGSFTLLTYWSLDDKNYEKNLNEVKKIFKKYGDRPDFKVVSFWMDDWPDYLSEMNKRGAAFYNSRNWWKLKFIDSDSCNASKDEKDRIWGNDIGKGKTPVYILLDKELKFLATEIPGNKLETTVDSYLNPEVKKAN